MGKNLSPRAYGFIILFIGLFLVLFNGYLAFTKGSFYGIASFLGPFATCYGLSVVVKPPEEMPQKKLDRIHSLFFILGIVFGLAYLLILMFVDLKTLFK